MTEKQVTQQPRDTMETVYTRRNDIVVQLVGIEQGSNLPLDNQMEQLVPIQTQGRFHLSWAQGMQDELQRAAELSIQPTGRFEPVWLLASNDTEIREHYIPDSWEERDPLTPDFSGQPMTPASICQPTWTKTKVRKPIVITKWFGEDISSEELDSEGTLEWTEVDRRKASKDKNKIMENKRKNGRIECATKAEHMAGIGMIYVSDVTARMDSRTDFEAAKIIELNTFLLKYLGYNKEELCELSLEETKFSTLGEDILYVTMAEKDQINELHIQRAESYNENITVRNYIPPNFHNRFVHLNQICAEQRRLDSSLKTQLWFGHGDIEVNTKHKGEGVGFKLVKLSDFTDIMAVPKFDHRIRWKWFVDKPPRQKISYCQENPSKGKQGMARPVTGKTDNNLPLKTLTRQHSKEEASYSKKVRLSAQSSSSASSSDEDEDTNEMDT